MEIKTINNRIHIIADEEMICTNGETYGSDIALAEGLDAKGFYEITYQEYENFSNENIPKI